MSIIRACRFKRVEWEHIDRCISHIEQNYLKPITAMHLADDFNINIRKVHKGFKIKTGSTVHEYLLKVRLENAKSLLLDLDLEIKEIPEKIGFNTSSHFGQVFKNRMGLTPQEFRLQQGTNALVQ